MSLQAKIRVNKSPSVTAFRNAPPYTGVAKQAPKTAGRNSDAHNLRPLSRARSTQLPVWNVNKANSTKRQAPADKALTTSPSVSKKSKQDKRDKATVSTGSQPGKIVSRTIGHVGEERGLLAHASGSDSPPHDSSDSNDASSQSEKSQTGSQAGSQESQVDNLNTQHKVTSTGSSSDNHTQTDFAPIQGGPPSAGLPHSTPDDPWHLAYNELRAMGERISKLDKIEKDVSTLNSQLSGIVSRTSDLEVSVQDHSKDITSLKSDLSKIQSSTDEYDTSFKDLWTFTNDIATKADQRIKEIKKAIQENIDKLDTIGDVKKEIKRQVEVKVQEAMQTFKDDLQIETIIKEEVNKQVQSQLKDAIHTATNEVRKDLSEQIQWSSQTTKKEISEVINRNTHHFQYERLQDKAFNSRLNLVLVGINENDQASAFSQASSFFKNKLKLKTISMDVAYRLGKPPPPDSPYSRPIVVRFSSIADRNSVWRKRNDVPREDEEKTVRIQADIPKQLREDLQILYRVQRAATKYEQYQTAEVKNYKLYLNEEEYSAWELEELPLPLRPSSLATRASDNALVFYSKHSALSNHFTAPFEVRGRQYANMEHYLAYKRAKLSGQKPIINKARLAQDPVEAKSILHSLKSDHREQWNKELSDLATEGLHAKFRQNASLGNYLCNTAPLTLGEASMNPQWGIGLSLEDKEVLNKSKWNKQGNLLGRLLMKVRNQIIHERQTQAATEKEKRKQCTRPQPTAPGSKSPTRRKSTATPT